MKMGFLEDIYKVIVDILERLGIIPRKETPIEIKLEIENYKNIVINEIKEVKKIKLKWDNKVISIKKKRAVVKDNKLKINAKFKNREILTNIEISKCIYYSLYNLLSKDGKVALKLYSNYKIAIKNNKEKSIIFIEKGLNNLQEKYKNIYYWFNLFKKLDLNGNLEGLIVPISKYIKDMNKEEFVKFIVSIINKEDIKQPIKINGNLLGIIKIGKEKTFPTYLSYVNHLIEGGCNKIIICGYGRWRDKVIQLSNTIEILYTMKKLPLIKKAFKNINQLKKDKESTLGYFIHLSK